MLKADFFKNCIFFIARSSLFRRYTIIYQYLRRTTFSTTHAWTKTLNCTHCSLIILNVAFNKTVHITSTGFPVMTTEPCSTEPKNLKTLLQSFSFFTSFTQTQHRKKPKKWYDKKELLLKSCKSLYSIC